MAAGVVGGEDFGGVVVTWVRGRQLQLPGS